MGGDAVKMLVSDTKLPTQQNRIAQEPICPIEDLVPCLPIQDRIVRPGMHLATMGDLPDIGSIP